MMVPKQPRRVLLVDDNVDVVEALSSGLLKRGYRVSSFRDPEVALKEFEPGNYDVALLDVRMEPMDGLELCRRLRKIDSELSVCFLTAYADSVSGWPERSKHFQKPITLDSLTEALEDIESRE